MPVKAIELTYRAACKASFYHLTAGSILMQERGIYIEFAAE